MKSYPEMIAEGMKRTFFSEGLISSKTAKSIEKDDFSFESPEEAKRAAQVTDKFMQALKKSKLDVAASNAYDNADASGNYSSLNKEVEQIKAKVARRGASLSDEDVDLLASVFADEDFAEMLVADAQKAKMNLWPGFFTDNNDI